MIERRGAGGVRDIGVRTRRTDRFQAPSTPYALPAWLSTFSLRWVDHLKLPPKDDEQKGA